MKKIILAVLLGFMCTFSGCAEEELIEIESENISADSTEQDKLCKPTTEEDNVAENSIDSQPLVVYVTGSINNPGVYELIKGSRVIDAINAAGGYSEDACDKYINLARLLTDEEMLYIPSDEEVMNAKENGNEEQVMGLESGLISNQGCNDTSNGKININKATKEELMTLPGIGESKAEKIIAYREQNGPFSSPEGIMEISGIKDGMYNKIKDSICTD